MKKPTFLQCKRVWCALLLFVSCAANTAVATQPANSWYEQPVWSDPERGYYWYPDPRLEKNEEKPKEAPQKSIYEMTDIEAIQKELNRIKGIAVVNPTESNVLEFLRAQNWVMNKASMFSDVSRRVVWANPEVNYAVRSPATNSARSANDVRTAKQRREVMADLSKDHGILFFARSDCAYCHDQAPILRGLEREYRISVLAVSMDGGPISMFPEAKRDNGISMVISGGQGITHVPTIYLVNRKTNDAIMIGSGVVSADEIAERIRVVTSTTPGQEF